METKVCKCCGRELKLSDYYKLQKNRDGLNTYCKTCHRKRCSGIPAAEIMDEQDKKLFNLLGGLKINILNYAKSGENRFNISSTEGQSFATNDKVLFMKKLSAVMELQTLPFSRRTTASRYDSGGFFMPGGSSYVQAKAKSCMARILLSECLNHRTPLFKQNCLRGLLLISVGVKYMSNLIKITTESTLESLYRYYKEVKSTWYKGKYTNEEETIYFNVFSALEDALIKLPIQSPQDRKIKLEMLKETVTFNMQTNTSELNWDHADGMEKESLLLINQIAAE